MRLLVGALLSAQSRGMGSQLVGRRLPEHRFWLDLPLAAACLLAAYRYRRPWLVAPIVPVVVHSLIQARIVGPPQTALEWGLASTLAGFAALGASLLWSWRTARTCDVARTRAG